jgi:hypothetical protein
MRDLVVALPCEARTWRSGGHRTDVKFHSDGITYKAVRITGPAHNLLGMEFASSDAVDDAVLVEPVHLKPMEPARLTAGEVQKWALEGLRQANEELGADFRVRRIMFVASDSPPAEVYCELAKRIALRLHARPTTFNGIE